MRATNFTQPAWALYRNSLLYLALLFAAMAVDGFVPVARGAAREPLQLRHPRRDSVAQTGRRAAPCRCGGGERAGGADVGPAARLREHRDALAALRRRWARRCPRPPGGGPRGAREVVAGADRRAPGARLRGAAAASLGDGRGDAAPGGSAGSSASCAGCSSPTSSSTTASRCAPARRARSGRPARGSRGPAAAERLVGARRGCGEAGARLPRGRRLSHPYFGRLPAAEALRSAPRTWSTIGAPAARCCGRRAERSRAARARRGADPGDRSGAAAKARGRAPARRAGRKGRLANSAARPRAARARPPGGMPIGRPGGRWRASPRARAGARAGGRQVERRAATSRSGRKTWPGSFESAPKLCSPTRRDDLVEALQLRAPGTV